MFEIVGLPSAHVEELELGLRLGPGDDLQPVIARLARGVQDPADAFRRQIGQIIQLVAGNEALADPLVETGVGAPFGGKQCLDPVEIAQFIQDREQFVHFRRPGEIEPALLELRTRQPVAQLGRIEVLGR